MTAMQTRKENIHFLEYAIKRVWMAAGASDIHAHYVADAICFAHRQGKLNQGLAWGCMNAWIFVCKGAGWILRLFRRW